MKGIKPYKYRNRPTLAPELNTGKSLIRTGTKEVFAGVIQGKKASDLEERFARAMDKLGIEYQFRVRISSLAAGTKRKLSTAFTNLPGEVEIDMLAEHHGRGVPIMIDGFIGHHRAPWQADVDREKKNIVDDFGKQYGWQETIRIPFYHLETQELADRKAKEIFI